MKNLLASSTKGAQIFIVISLIGTIIGLISFNVNLTTFMLILTGYFLYGCLGIVVTFHRNLTHRSYKTYKLIEKLFSILGCLGGTGSPLAWVAIHINHHLKSDKENDPHSPIHKGLKIFTLNYEHDIDQNTKWKMKHLITDKFQQFLHRYYFGIIICWSFILFLIGGMYLTIFLHWAPAVLTVFISNVVNYIGHMPNWVGGYRRYNLNDRSTNNWVWAIPSWGETWHNNHHRYPKNYNCGQTWWELDISGIIIRLIKK